MQGVNFLLTNYWTSITLTSLAITNRGASQMTTTTQFDGTVEITEKRMSYQEAEQIYGTSDVGKLNRKLGADADRATDGNCYQWAMYSNGGIAVVTEC